MWRDARFRGVWVAQFISEVGSGVGAVALPLTAVLTLGASAFDMGVLAASSTLPVLLLALHAGVWVDRVARRPILIATNLGRGAILALVPLAAFAGALRIEVLWGVALAVGVLTVLFDIALTSFVPSLVERGRLVDANGSLHAGAAAARVAGPGAGGWLVQVIGAPFALAADALSFLVSAALLARLRIPEHTQRAMRRGVWAEIREGIVTVWCDRILRPMVLTTTIASFGGSVLQAVYVLFAVREVELTPQVLGAVVACGSLAGLAGAATAGRTARLLGAGGTMLVGQLGVALGTVVLLAAQPGSAGTLVVALAQVLFMGGLQTFSVTQISLRQAITPPHVLGRVNATRRVAAFGIQPVGALVGGALGTAFGLRAALLVAAVVQLIALATMVASPLREAREVQS